jgi:hypothetical protein
LQGGDGRKAGIGIKYFPDPGVWADQWCGMNGVEAQRRIALTRFKKVCAKWKERLAGAGLDDSTTMICAERDERCGSHGASDLDD